MIDRRIKLRHLQYFLEVARQRSVMKAADVLAISQPSVSKTIRELEEALGVDLLDRSKRNVALTPFGEVFLRHAGASISALRQGLDSIAQIQQKGAYTITIGVLPTVAARVIPEAILAFKAQGLETTIRVVTGANTVLLSQLRLGEVDLVVGRLADPELMTGLAFEHLYSERIAFLVRPGHPLLAETPFDLNRLRDFTVLYPTEGAIIRPFADRLLIANGIGTLPDKIETVSPSFGRKYTRKTDAVWVISQGVVADDLAGGLLVELPVDTLETLGPVGLTTRADAVLNLPTQMLMAAIRRAASTVTPPAARPQKGRPT